MIGFLKNWSDARMRATHAHKVRKSEKNAFVVMLASHHSIKKNRNNAKLSTPFLNFCFDDDATAQPKPLAGPWHNCQHLFRSYSYESPVRVWLAS